jgi:hypothetical protein
VSARRIDQDMAAAAAGLLTRPVTPELRTRYRQLRVMLPTAGLAATYAFIAAKAGPEAGPLAGAYANAARGIVRRLADRQMLTGDPARLGAREVLRQLGEMPGTRYARASTEAAALVGWLSRLADACYQEDRQQNGSTGTADAADPAVSSAGLAGDSR